MQNSLTLLFLYLFSLIWSLGVGMKVTPTYAFWIFIIILIVILLGDLIFKAIVKEVKFDNLPTRVVLGTLLLNLIIYLFTFISPFGIKNNFIIIALLTSLSYIIYLKKNKFKQIIFFEKTSNPELILLLLTPIVVGIWCQDFINIIETDSGYIKIQAWQDIYYHLTQINIFSMSNGLSTIYDPQMSGSIARPYHHASYMLSSLIVGLTGVSSLHAYVIALVPVGMILAIYGAYSLSRVVFGEWPALAGSMAILLLPDAYQQGMGNPYLSYHWLIQIGPAQGYGIAAAALAMALLLTLKDSWKINKILLAYFLVFTCLLHKAHIFVPISFIALILPIIMANKIKLSKQILLFFVVSLIYIVVVSASQLINFGPTLRLNGANLMEYSSTVFNMQENGFVRSLFEINVGNSWAQRLVIFPIYLLVITFGIYPIVYLIQIKKVLICSNIFIALLPLLTVFIYLLMSVFLEYDKTGTGAPEELHHRPFVWAYFVLVLWTSSITYITIYGNKSIKSGINSYVLYIFVGILALFVLFNGSGMQANRIWGKGYQTIPECYFNVAEYIKNNSYKNAIFQDSLNDKNFIWSGLIERQAYAVDAGGFREPKGLQERINFLNELNHITNIEQVSIFLKNAAIDWYITSLKGTANWEINAKEKLVFSCGDYRIYNFN